MNKEDKLKLFRGINEDLTKHFNALADITEEKDFDLRVALSHIGGAKGAILTEMETTIRKG